MNVDRSGDECLTLVSGWEVINESPYQDNDSKGFLKARAFVEAIEYYAG